MQGNDLCKYHPNKQSSWHCHHCVIPFCVDCVPLDVNKPFPKCVLCRRDLHSLSVASQEDSFWNSLSLFFLLPLKNIMPIVILAFSFLFALIPEGKAGLAIGFLLTMPLSNFLFTLMEKLANGEPVPTNLSSIFASDNKLFFVRLLFGLIAIFIIVNKMTAFLDVKLVNLFAAFFLFGVPASLSILMMEKRFLSLMNPAKISAVIKLFGKAYILVYGIFCLVVYLFLQLFFSTDIGQISFAKLTVGYSILLYFLIVAFVMIGRLIFQFHFELNYRVRMQAVLIRDEHREKGRKRNNKMAEVEIFIQEGRFEDAQKILLNKISSNPMDVVANEKLILLYSFQGKEHHANEITKKYFKVLVNNKKQKQAADFYSKLINKDIVLNTLDPLIALSLLKEMNNRHQYKTAINLLNEYSCIPNDTLLWDELAFEKANLLYEYEDNVVQATSILNLIIRRSVNQALLEKAQKLLNSMG